MHIPNCTFAKATNYSNEPCAVIQHWTSPVSVLFETSNAPGKSEIDGTGKDGTGVESTPAKGHAISVSF